MKKGLVTLLSAVSFAALLVVTLPQDGFLPEPEAGAPITVSINS